MLLGTVKSGIAARVAYERGGIVTIFDCMILLAVLIVLFNMTTFKCYDVSLRQLWVGTSHLCGDKVEIMSSHIM